MSHIVQTWLLHYHKLPSWCPYFVKLIAENAQNFHFYDLLAHTFLSGGKYLTEVNVVPSVMDSDCTFLFVLFIVQKTKIVTLF